MKSEHSAGGIVLKKENSVIYVLMAQHAQYHGWGFPKGHIGDIFAGESQEDTALREVKEETGIDAEIIKFACEETYQYKWQGEKRKKIVYYYVMRYKSGNFAGKDHEMEAVEWVELDKVEAKLTYDNAKKMFRKLLPEIREIAKNL
ncbi:MAG TPA: NUDIX domain-containing protein [Candidatus Levybacteria bacterium]|mgnify:CR=1 FL=1|nr:NUDIX domain-containing protein [Candidatus Levybacteria bacterium]